MPVSGSYYKSSGLVSVTGIIKAGLLTVILSFILSWLFVWAKYSVTLDWLQLIFLIIFALLLSALHRSAVRFGKFQNRIIDVLWSLFTVVCGTYASWIIRVARLHPEHPVVVLPSPVWSGLKEAYSFGVQYYVNMSRILEPGMHTVTDPFSTIILELCVLGAVVILGAVFLSQEEFFCRECNSFFDVKSECINLTMPSDFAGVQKELENGSSGSLLDLSKASEQQARMKVVVFRCSDESHPGIIRISLLTDKKEKVLIKGIYMESRQCDLLQQHLNTMK